MVLPRLGLNTVVPDEYGVPLAIVVVIFEKLESSVDFSNRLFLVVRFRLPAIARHLHSAILRNGVNELLDWFQNMLPPFFFFHFIRPPIRLGKTTHSKYISFTVFRGFITPALTARFRNSISSASFICFLNSYKFIFISLPLFFYILFSTKTI